MVEIWKPVKGYEGLYDVSNLGNIYSHYYCRNLTAQLQKESGYLYVTLSKDQHVKRCRIHRLVAEAFIPNENPDKTQVNHKDENKANNCVDNLEWVSLTENCNYGTRNERISTTRKERHPKKVKPSVYKPVQCIETGIVYKTTREAERQTGVNHSSISACVNGRYKTAGGYHWEHYEP